MQIVCPECRFAREVDESKIPARSQVATCPKCQTKFKFRDLPEPEFLIEEPEPASAPEPTPAPKAEPEAKPVTRRSMQLPLEPRDEKTARPATPARPTTPTRPEPEKTFPDLPDPDENSSDALWRRLHKMTPPDKTRPMNAPDDSPMDEPTYRDTRDEQPVPGWTGEFNEDFPDPMQGEFLDEEDEPQADMQVPPPFEQLDRYGFFNGLFMTLKLILVSPRLFFSVMPVGNGLSKPLTFAILVAMIQSVAQYAWGVAGLTPGVDVTGQGFQAAAYDATNGIFELLLTPAFVALSLFVIAGFYHAILAVLKGGDKGFEGSFRAVAYAYAPMMTGIIPMFTVEFMAGWMFLYAIWGLVLTGIGLKYIHKTSYGKVIPVLLVPLLLGMIVAMLMMQGHLPTA